MEKNNQNVFGYIDEMQIDELLNLQNELLNDIDYLKEINDNKNLDFEIERLRYVNKILKDKYKNQENGQKLSK